MTPAEPRAVASGDGTLEHEGATPRWLLGLEQAHALAQRSARALEAAAASEVDLGPAARAVEEVLARLYGAFDLREDRLHAAQAAQAALDRAAAALDAIAASPAGDAALADAAGWLRTARLALGPAVERFERMPPELAPAPPPLGASVDVPRLHVVPRASLVPTLRVAAPVVEPVVSPAPPLPTPTTEQELDATIAELERRAAERRRAAEARRAEKPGAAPEPEEPAAPLPGFARDVPPQVSEDDFIAARMRECFEEVAMVGTQRAPLLGDAWRTSRVLERRMLAAADAIAALGSTAIARIEPLVLDAPAKDPARGFAAAFVLGSLAGRDALAAAERIVRHLGLGDRQVFTLVASAFALVPHAELGLAMRTALDDEDPALRALGVTVLVRRGLATVAELAAAAADPHPAIASTALPALALAAPGELAAVLDAALERPEPEVREAAWTAMALGGHPRAADVVARALGGPDEARAAVELALVGDDHDADRLLERARSAPTEALVTALGWAGASECVPTLIALLGQGEPALGVAAAYALDRLTGARLLESVTVEPETIAVDEPPEPDVGEPRPSLARQVSDPRDLPSDGSPDTITRPATRADRWAAWWAEHGKDFRAGVRYRRGHPYWPAVSLWELDGWPVTVAERRLLQRELVIRTGQVVRFDPDDLVVVQEEAIRQWEPIARRASVAAGSWSRPPRR